MKFKPGDVVRLKDGKRESIVERLSLNDDYFVQLVFPLRKGLWHHDSTLRLVYRPNSKEFKAVRVKK